MTRGWRWSICAAWVAVLLVQFVWVDAADPQTPGVGPQDAFVVIALFGFFAVIVAAILNWDVTPELACLVSVDALAASLFDVHRAPNLYVPEMMLYVFVLGFSVLAALGARPDAAFHGRPAWEDPAIAERVDREKQLAAAVIVLGFVLLGLLNRAGFFSGPEDADLSDLQAVLGILTLGAFGVGFVLLGNNFTKRRVLRRDRFHACTVAMRLAPYGRSSRQLLRLTTEHSSFVVAPSAFRHQFETSEHAAFCGNVDLVVVIRRSTGQLVIARAAPFAWIQRRRQRVFGEEST